MSNPSARITRVHTSWRVRVPGHPAAFFADGKHGGKDASFEAAREWRDERWDGQNRHRSKLSEEQRIEIISSDEPAAVLAARYGISRQYVYNLWWKARAPWAAAE